MAAPENPIKLEVEEVRDADQDTCCTFIMHDEDHTLGNALRYMISKNPDVEFCGYSMPHPSENKINFRIQTKGTLASDVLRKGLEDLNSVCEHVLTTFKTSVQNYQANQERDNPS